MGKEIDRLRDKVEHEYNKLKIVHSSAVFGASAVAGAVLVSPIDMVPGEYIGWVGGVGGVVGLVGLISSAYYYFANDFGDEKYSFDRRSSHKAWLKSMEQELKGWEEIERLRTQDHR